jgi:hypothetical protein
LLLVVTTGKGEVIREIIKVFAFNLHGRQSLPVEYTWASLRADSIEQAKSSETWRQTFHLINKNNQACTMLM